MKGPEPHRAASGRSRLVAPLSPAARRVSLWLLGLLERFQPSETALLVALAIGIGALTGLAAVLFIRLIEWIAHLGFEELPALAPGLGRGWIVLVPVLGALLGGPIIAWFAREAKGHGVPEVMQAIVQRGGRIRPRVAVAKIAASSLCIGSGGSAGREGPIVQVGSTLGSALGQLFRMSDERIRNLVACGAAAGVAATFNAPIAGVAFAMEVLVGSLGLSLVSNVVLSAVTASVVSRLLLGGAHAFQIPTYHLESAWEMPLYLALGVLAAGVGVLFIKVLYAAEDAFDGWRRAPLWIKPAVGALLLGLVALAYPPLLASAGIDPALARAGLPVGQNVPHVFGSGLGAISEALGGPLPWALLGSLVVLKMLATALTLGSGNSGGVFAPSLFMGAMLGGLFGVAVQPFVPGLDLQPGAYALAGMAAVFAGAARAPLTAILIAFEMSNDYGLILPLMATTITASLVGHKLSPESIYTLKLARRGLVLRHGREVDVLDSVRVSEVMDLDPPVLAEDLPLAEVERWFVETHRHGAMVLDDRERLVGLVTLQDMERARQEFPDAYLELPLSAVMTRSLLKAYPDEPIGAALERIALRDIGRMPVVDRDEPDRLLGLIRRRDLARAYQRGLLRRREAEHLDQHRRASREGDVQFLELEVRPGSAVAGRTVAELALPDGVLLTTRRREAHRRLLHGGDRIEAGDVILALAERRSIDALRGMFRT